MVKQTILMKIDNKGMIAFLKTKPGFNDYIIEIFERFFSEDYPDKKIKKLWKKYFKELYKKHCCGDD